MRRDKRLVGKVYRWVLIILALVWCCQSLEYAALFSFIAAVGALCDYAYRPQSRSLESVGVKPARSRSRWRSMMGTTLRVIGTHWRAIANVLLTVAVITLMLLGALKAYRTSSAWLGDQKRRVVTWINEATAELKSQSEARAARERQYQEFLKTFAIEDFDWFSVELSEEAKAQFVNKVQGHNYVLYATFTIRAEQFPLKDFVVVLEVHPPSDTDIETVTSDIIRDGVEPKSSKRFNRVRIGTSTNGKGTAAFRVISAAFAKP